MDKLSHLAESTIDSAIDRVVAKLSACSKIKALYPNQRMILHQFCRGRHIIYTGIVDNYFQTFPPGDQLIFGQNLCTFSMTLKVGSVNVDMAG